MMAKKRNSLYHDIMWLSILKFNYPLIQNNALINTFTS